MGEQISKDLERITLKFIDYKTIEKLTSGIDNKEFLVDILSHISRINTLSMIMFARSGHIGTSFSSMEIFQWLINYQLGNILDDEFENILIASKGHDAPGYYSSLHANKIIPDEKLRQLRRLDGLPGHPDVQSSFVSTNTGSLGMGISKAKGFIYSDRIKSVKRKVFVLCGDGEMQEGQNWEALRGAVNDKLGNLTVVIDNNKLQSDTLVNNVSDLGDLLNRFTSTGWIGEECDGNDIKSIENAFQKLDGSNKDLPKVIIANTTKGKGVSFMEIDENFPPREYAYHSGATSENEYFKGIDELEEKLLNLLEPYSIKEIVFTEEHIEENIIKKKESSTVQAYSESLVEIGKNSNVLVLDADLAKDCGLIEFEKNYPDRFLEFGIAEQDMVSSAGTMALNGFLPIVNSFSCFLIPRANEQIYNNATQKSKLFYTGVMNGVLPAAPGHSHQSIRDIALMRSVPNLDVIEPWTAKQVEDTLKYYLEEHTNSIYMRINPIPHSSTLVYSELGLPEKGQGSELFSYKNSSTSIVVHSPLLVDQTINVIREFEKRGVEVNLFVASWLNSFDRKWWQSKLNSSQDIFIFENGLISGGWAEYFSTQLTNNANTLHIKGLEDVPPCGQSEEVLNKVGLSSVEIYKYMSSVIEKV
tara:strand:- start:13524 stop:15455 length:1932 start_codon:yes stop_codon:yes gene_type:complete